MRSTITHERARATSGVLRERRLDLLGLRERRREQRLQPRGVLGQERGDVVPFVEVCIFERMTVAEFKSELETFLQGLEAHQIAWRNAQGWFLSGVKRQALDEQAHRLARHLGRLRPYIYHFIGAPLWVMHLPSVSRATWNALDAAVGTTYPPPVKGSSMERVVSKLNQLLGRLDGMNPAEELPPPITPKQTPVTPPQTAPMYSPGPQATAPDPPPPAAPSTPPDAKAQHSRRKYGIRYHRGAHHSDGANRRLDGAPLDGRDARQRACPTARD